MYKTILTVIASLAVLALGVSIVNAVLQQSSINHQAKQVAALEAAQSVDHRELGQLQARLHRRHAATTTATRIPVTLLVLHTRGLGTVANCAPTPAVQHGAMHAESLCGRH